MSNDFQAENDRWHSIENLFHAAAELPEEERLRFLDQACAGKKSLRREVERLLNADRSDAGFLEAPASEPRSTSAAFRSLGALVSEGMRIGPYRLVREIGAGGMGTVWLAERADEQFRMNVAIKLIKPGMHTQDILRRFQNEKQVLASIKHPGIARLLDGGETETGLPYLIMDYVDGIPIDTFCDKHRLTLAERLKLFLMVCDAVRHAHRNLVVHRDIKPQNILVTPEGKVKLLDFGIAKVIAPQAAADSTEVTVTVHQMLTPRYASPEQVRGQPITTASDVYSLGVLLYELLTGHRPYQFDSTSAAFVERIICEQEPTKPSTIVNQIAERSRAGDASETSASPDAISAARSVDLKKLRRELAGDLDTIVLMAMRKDPERRYASVEQFAEDLHRYGEGLPVVARPDTLRYRSAKFVLRHKVGVMSAALVLVVSIVGFVTSTTSYFRANAARQAEEQQRRVAQEVSSFLRTMLGSVNPRKAMGKDTTLLRELVDEAALRIERNLDGQPEVQALLEDTIGQVYYSLGLYGKAETYLTSALNGLRHLYGEENSGTLTTMCNLALLRQDQGRLDEAETLFRQALTTRRRVFGERHAFTLSSLNFLGNLYRARHKLHDAERLLRQAVSLRREVLGESHPDTLVSMNNLSNVLSVLGNYAEAETSLRELLVLQEATLPAGHLDLLVSKNDLAVAFKNQNKYAEAEPLYREVLAGFRRVLGGGHMDTLITMNNLAGLLWKRGARQESVELFQQLVDVSVRSLPPDSYETAVFRGGLGRALVELERFDEAEAELVICCATLASTLGPEHNYTQAYTKLLIELYEKTHRPNKAAAYRSNIPKEASITPPTATGTSEKPPGSEQSDR